MAMLRRGASCAAVKQPPQKAESRIGSHFDAMLACGRSPANKPAQVRRSARDVRQQICSNAFGERFTHGNDYNYIREVRGDVEGRALRHSGILARYRVRVV